MKNKENQFNFVDSDESSEQKNSSKKPIKKRVKMVDNDDKEMILMKKERSKELSEFYF